MEEVLKRNIPILKSATQMEEISKGYSADKKYLICLNGDQKYLLHMSHIREYKRKKAEFHIMNKIKDLNVSCPRAIEIGSLEELEMCYSLFSYVEGEDAKIILPRYTTMEQYNIGLEASQDLRRMHSLQAPNTIDPWFDRVIKKFRRYIDEYHTCGKRIKHDDKISHFVENNVNYIKKRPNRFQHDDFHLDNIIVKENHYSGVIDFNRYDWGDPIHEFVKVGMFSRETSIPYSIGQIKGYFNHNIPAHFWRLYSVYLAMTVISSVVWTLKVVPDTIDEMLARLDRVLEDHKNFDSLIPGWFSQKSIFE